MIGGGVCDTSAIATPPGEELATVVDESTKCEPCAWWHRRRQSRCKHVVIKWSSSGHQVVIKWSSSGDRSAIRSRYQAAITGSV